MVKVVAVVAVVTIIQPALMRAVMAGTTVKRPTYMDQVELLGLETIKVARSEGLVEEVARRAWEILVIQAILV